MKSVNCRRPGPLLSLSLSLFSEIILMSGSLLPEAVLVAADTAQARFLLCWLLHNSCFCPLPPVLHVTAVNYQHKPDPALRQQP